MSDRGFRDFHRIVKTNPATRVDFLSAEAKGVPPADDPARRAAWNGLSVYSTLAQARRKRRESPVLGSFISTLRVPLDGSVRVERTFGPGHHTIWGDPDALLALVIAVEPA